MPEIFRDTESLVIGSNDWYTCPFDSEGALFSVEIELQKAKRIHWLSGAAFPKSIRNR